uniref:Roadblock/LAMTOR2 domain-containing protein n=1 Tax=Nothobranchius furzeri TaxID=105023 RepID=A0A8C6P9X1_NOTFU
MVRIKLFNRSHVGFISVKKNVTFVQQAEVEDTLKRIEAREDVVGIIIVNLDGVYLRSTLDDALTAQYTKHLDRLTVMARSVVRNIDPEDDLTSLRLRIEKNDKHEIMVGLGGYHLFTLCVCDVFNRLYFLKKQLLHL